MFNNSDEVFNNHLTVYSNDTAQNPDNNQNKEDSLNAKKTELAEATKKLQRSRSDSDLVRVISLACEVAEMLQEMYLSMRDKNSELEKEIKKLKSVASMLMT
jgi:hypothetical protein